MNLGLVCFTERHRNLSHDCTEAYIEVGHVGIDRPLKAARGKADLDGAKHLSTIRRSTWGKSGLAGQGA